MNVLVIAEHDNLTLKSATSHVVTAAKVFSDSCTLVVMGSQCEAVVEKASGLQGVDTVLHVDDARFENPVAEDVAVTLFSLAKDFDVILAAASTFGKNILPRLAALYDVAQYSDVINIIDNDTYDRPIYAGNVIQRVKSLDAKKIMTIRTTAFAATDVDESTLAKIEKQNAEFESPLSTFMKREEIKSLRPELTEATVVVSGGRALQSEENFKLIEDLADVLEGAVGASRAAVDAGYIANDHQVGQTGKIVAPTLYIAVGISGAIQHLAGMKDSKVIVAINKDEDAPIFQIATYGLVGDLFKIVPELIEKLKE
jgi:electron transfer flavoprotein alpha subunit